MIDFRFEHEGNTIKLVNTYYGREKVYFNNELVTNNLNWKNTNIHDFEINSTKYRISIRLNSALNCDVTVKLFVNEKLIETQTKTADSYININGSPAFSEEEISWKKEIEMSKKNQVLSNVLYFSLFFYGLSEGLFDSNTGVILSLIALVGAVTFSLFDFFRTSYKAL